VVWIDADAMFLAFDEDLADEMPAFAFQAFVLEHSHWGLGPNTGVWAMRNEPESFPFLDELDRIGPHPAKPNSDRASRYGAETVSSGRGGPSWRRRSRAP
jgi:hypothetical protein